MASVNEDQQDAQAHVNVEYAERGGNGGGNGELEERRRSGDLYDSDGNDIP